MLHLWLDDDPVRDPEGWLIVRTAAEAIAALQAHAVDILSLDHDLSDHQQIPYPVEYTGYDVAVWLTNGEPRRWPHIINVHSHNKPGTDRMLARLLTGSPRDVEIVAYRYDKDTAAALVRLFVKASDR